MLQGATAEDSFSISCGLGTTMTSEDILEGLMKISIKVALVNPAEFDVITIQQEMQISWTIYIKKPATFLQLAFQTKPYFNFFFKT